MTFPNISKHKFGDVDFPLKHDPLLHRWWQYCDVFEVLVADPRITPWTMAPREERDLEHDYSDYGFFFSASSFPGLSSHNFPTFRQLVAKKILPSKNR